MFIGTQTACKEVRRGRSKANMRVPKFKSYEHFFESILFNSRWLLAPAYVVLVGTIAVLSYKSIEEFVQLILNIRVFD